MSLGKSISLFLIDGIPDGVIACELSNWTGKGYKIPRNSLKDVSNRSDLKKPGVYFLIGHNEDDKETVYIGESEDVFKRLYQHQEKDFWTEALVFISKDENLNKAHIKYLEFSLHNEAVEANRYKVFNSNVPTKPAISEAEIAVMSGFSTNLKLLVGALGFRIFEKLTKSLTSKQDKYLIDAARGAVATGIMTTEGFVVFKGSKIASTEVPSMPESFKKKRAQIISENVVIDFEFTQDYLFSSPSTAAAVVMGRSANGLKEWKLKDGSNLGENEQKD
ncbi:MAG: hypothetical protein KFBDDELM_00001 [Candidatus Argoarchaeum ethanivorans]|uniref:DUF4357 domain-containing protein n=1 Tax=Candidatus Argoarchaeum ethanivorans TaxID=2608793 RepID=A0A811T041_9EURY|nr:MAG: hypothetical protein KFBDDELM_00001 [Candidatus Argoarchaeum ethanivorans]